MTERILMAVLSLIAAGIATGCIRSNAPPIRTGGFGAAGRVAGGELSAGISPSARLGQSGSVFRFGLDPSFVGGISDHVALELGGSFAPKLQAMGWGGPRFTVTRDVTGSALSVDVGFGGGAGIGGEVCHNGDYEKPGEDDSFSLLPECEGGPERWDGVPWRERTAGGGYLDIGFSWRAGRYGSISVRPRVQISGAEGLPMTIWYDVVLGPQFSVHGFDFHVGLAPTVFTNDWQLGFMLGLEFGISFSSL